MKENDPKRALTKRSKEQGYGDVPLFVGDITGDISVTCLHCGITITVEKEALTSYDLATYYDNSNTQQKVEIMRFFCGCGCPVYVAFIK